jgi:predicted metal-dependent phosphoesterase TrpH
MLKIDFHTHTAEDPQDRIAYSARDLIDRAAAKGFDALAVTNHNAVTYGDDLRKYAAAKGLLLLPGAELTMENRHILVINPRFPVGPGIRYSLSDLARIKTPDSLFIAPHPFFIIFQSLGKRLPPLLPFFDAIEFASYYNRLVNFNAPAVRLAAASGKPLVGTSDAHTEWQFGRTYALVDADKDLASIIAAVKAGRLEYRTRPLSLWLMLRIVAEMFSWRKIRRLFER